MSLSDGLVPSSPAGSAHRVRESRRRRLALAALALAIGLTVLAIGTASGGIGDPLAAANNSTDDRAPRLVDGTRINDTAVRLVVSDDVNVNESSIGVDDFVHEAGTPAAINVSENGPNATVRLSLGRRVQNDNLTVAVANGGAIADEAGNVLTGSSSSGTVVTVTGMDGVVPAVRSFDAEADSGGPVHLDISVSERLAGINISVYGALADDITQSSFSFDQSSYTYTTTYRPNGIGNVTFELENVTDENGNTAPVAMTEEVFIDTVPPTARASIVLAASTNRTLTFDASQSSDSSGIASSAWEFGDGTSATGERVSHAFAPGTYTVELTVTDKYGNIGTDTLDIDLTGGANGTDTQETDATVRIEQGQNVTAASTFVQIADGTAGERITVVPASGGLVSGEGFSLEELHLTLGTNGSGNIGLSTTDMASLAGITDEGEYRPIGGFSAIQNLPGAGPSNVTFELSVETQRLTALDAPAENLTLLRATTAEWEALSTTMATVSNDTVEYTAHSPGFSQFAIAVPTAESDETPQNQSTTPTPTATASSETSPTPGAETQTPTSTGAASDRQFAVTNVTLDRTTVPPGEPVQVTATVVNRGNSPGGYTAGLTVDGSVVETDFIGLNPGNRTSADFTYQTNQTGNYRVAVNGTMANEELTVGESGSDGILGSVLGVFGFLPLGLLRTVLTFVVVPIALVFLLLKGLAIYLGY